MHAESAPENSKNQAQKEFVIYSKSTCVQSSFERLKILPQHGLHKLHKEKAYLSKEFP